MFKKKNLKNTFDKNDHVILQILRHFVNCNPFYFCNTTRFWLK